MGATSNDANGFRTAKGVIKKKKGSNPRLNQSMEIRVI